MGLVVRSKDCALLSGIGFEHDSWRAGYERSKSLVHFCTNNALNQFRFLLHKFVFMLNLIKDLYWYWHSFVLSWIQNCVHMSANLWPGSEWRQIFAFLQQQNNLLAQKLWYKLFLITNINYNITYNLLEWKKFSASQKKLFLASAGDLSWEEDEEKQGNCETGVTFTNSFTKVQI